MAVQEGQCERRSAYRKERRKASVGPDSFVRVSAGCGVGYGHHRTLGRTHPSLRTQQVKRAITNDAVYGRSGGCLPVWPRLPPGVEEQATRAVTALQDLYSVSRFP